MPLYFGLPVTCREAFRLFDLDFDEIVSDIMKTHKLTINMHMDCYFVGRLNKFFKEKGMRMKTFYTDKGQCIIGYEIVEVSNFQKKFIDVDQFIIQLTNLKTEFSMETKIFERNFRHVILEHMEDEPETANFPEPYMIEHN